MPPTSPTLAVRELGLRLRESREALGMTGLTVATAIGITQNYVSNVEHGRRTISQAKLLEMAHLYRLDAPTRENLVALRKASESRGWWSQYATTCTAELLRYLGHEHGAEEIRTYEYALVSGLLQTESYARSVHRGDGANLRKAEVETRVQARLRRIERLHGDDPIRAMILMNEAALYQQVGGTGVLAEQLRHLLNLAENNQNTVELRIIPFTAGSFGALGGSTFHVLKFPQGRLPEVAWEESCVSMDLVEQAGQVARYKAAFVEAQSHAADRQGSASLIRTALEAVT